ncbi:uncharacterized protein Tco025E_07764 [Trypanosoma conorhini]|uniref:Uncharacterized protein n=1 Tax=Trypanosoma conorhini TaxID=83891 RepID=A0A3R7KGD7_9TRYP|nr:uncharacterized protein Tco025E_07764 [Trypanosoma conorhini]RNF05980.1 hypothetical protein Tco025E_07764 [Trypanosoma conorhini]
MSEGLLTQWRDRVVEAETEISVVQEDIGALLNRRKEIKQDISRYDRLVQREKQEMLKRLEEVEAQAQELEDGCQKTLQQKTRVEEAYVQTLDNYESMHDSVKEIQRGEQQLQEREDVEAVLQRESLAWAEEEHGLRTKLHALQSALKAARRERHEEVTALDTELAAAERELLQVRGERQGEMQAQHQQLQPTKHDRQGTPHASTQRAASASAEANKKEQQFIAANASASIPTRPLRSCLKNTGAATGSSFNAAGSNSVYQNASAPHYKSAPASRAVSQSLVTGDEAVDGGVGSTPATQHRAYSYAAGKKLGGTKRDILPLGDATNR